MTFRLAGSASAPSSNFQNFRPNILFPFGEVMRGGTFT